MSKTLNLYFKAAEVNNDLLYDSFNSRFGMLPVSSLSRNSTGIGSAEDTKWFIINIDNKTELEIEEMKNFEFGGKKAFTRNTTYEPPKYTHVNNSNYEN